MSGRRPRGGGGGGAGGNGGAGGGDRSRGAGDRRGGDGRSGRRRQSDDRRRGRTRETRPGGPPRSIEAGEVAVRQALERHPDHVHAVWLDKAQKRELVKFADDAKRHGARPEWRPASDLDALGAGAGHAVLAVVGEYRYRPLEALREAAGDAPLFVALDEIQDPHNLGAIVRSALAFAADGVIVPERRTAPITAAAVRASAGGTERIGIAAVTNLARTLDALARDGLEVVGLAGDGDDRIDALGPPPEAGRVIVVGSEGRGLRRLVREHCTRVATIPMPGGTESLNASVAAALALYEAHRSARSD